MYSIEIQAAALVKRTSCIEKTGVCAQGLDEILAHWDKFFNTQMTIVHTNLLAGLTETPTEDVIKRCNTMFKAVEKVLGDTKSARTLLALVCLDWLEENSAAEAVVDNTIYA